MYMNNMSQQPNIVSIIWEFFGMFDMVPVKRLTGLALRR